MVNSCIVADYPEQLPLDLMDSVLGEDHVLIFDQTEYKAVSLDI